MGVGRRSKSTMNKNRETYKEKYKSGNRLQYYDYDFQVISKDLDVNSEYFRNGLTDKFGLPQLRNNDTH